jgi:hypothetical protein
LVSSVNLGTEGAKWHVLPHHFFNLIVKLKTKEMKTQNKAKHTEGNWRVRDLSTVGILIATKDKNICLAIDTGGMPRDEAEANAKLIAASPIMLSVLQDVISVLNEQLTGDAMDNPDIAKMMQDVESAISKATN